MIAAPDIASIDDRSEFYDTAQQRWRHELGDDSVNFSGHYGDVLFRHRNINELRLRRGRYNGAQFP